MRYVVDRVDVRRDRRATERTAADAAGPIIGWNGLGGDDGDADDMWSSVIRGRAAEPDRMDPDCALRQAAQLEEMAARTHERAAELYESWLKHRGRTQQGGLEHRARMHREIAVATRSVDCLAERTLHGFEARLEAGTPSTGAARSLVTLSALARLRDLIERRIAKWVAAGRREGASWAEIGTALHVTRQTAHQRYR
jgi:hypothetical protein